MNAPVHISSLLITARPTLLDSVRAALLANPIVEIAHSDPVGKIIVTLETDDESHIVQTLTDIQLVDGVVNASLVFHQIDDAIERQSES